MGSSIISKCLTLKMQNHCAAGNTKIHCIIETGKSCVRPLTKKM